MKTTQFTRHSFLECTSLRGAATAFPTLTPCASRVQRENDMKTVQQLVLVSAITSVITSNAAGAKLASAKTSILRIYIIHFSHTDIGFTNMPGVCQELQWHYLDIMVPALRCRTSSAARRSFLGIV